MNPQFFLLSGVVDGRDDTLCSSTNLHPRDSTSASVYITLTLFIQWFVHSLTHLLTALVLEALQKFRGGGWGELAVSHVLV